MQLAQHLKQTYQNIPTPVKLFLQRALLLFILWKLLFHLLLLPQRIPDKFLSDSNAYFTTKCFEKIYPNSLITTREYKDYRLYKEGIDHILIMRDNKAVVGVTDGCNGLEVFVLYLGFLICIPTNWRRQLLFAIGGILLLYFFNVLRVVGLGLLHQHYREAFDIAHHYIFKLFIYGVVFYLWVLYAKKSALVNE